tara:strand:+ start:3138 stop:3560 length:423 start_codon:yes stop_codon:yes gene_type:complete
LILNKDINIIKRDAKLIKELASLYFSTFNRQLKVSCGSCIHTQFVELSVHLKHVFKMEETKCNFKLSVSSIREFSSTAVHTNLTLTDEVAIAYLKVNINRLSQFSKYPSNLDELLSGKKIKQEVKKSVKKEYKKTTKKNK